MEENQQRNNKKKYFYVIGSLILLIVLIGVTYAFFNYTRTGTENVIRPGRINFNSSYTEFNLTNAFPITSQQASEVNNPNAKEISINVVGDTDYVEGLEYLVSAKDVSLTVGESPNEKKMPLTIEVGVTNNGAKSLGTIETGDYYSLRNGYKNGGANKYKVVFDGELDEGDRILVGYIAPNSTPGTASGVDGIITMKAYIDASRILISDTYPAGEVDTNNDNVTDYTDGTPSSMAEGKVVFTTSEWNSIQGSPLSFKIRIEANEGIWIPNPGSAPLELEEIENTSIVPTTSRIIPITTEGDGELSCTSSNESIATCEIENTTGPTASPSNNENISPKVSYLELAESEVKASNMANRYANLIIHAHGEGEATITVRKASGKDYATPSVLTYNVTVAKQSTTMSLSSNNGTVIPGNNITATITSNGDGVLSCSSSTASASCSISGTTLTINGVSAGNAVITVSQTAGTTHLAPSDVTYSVTVNKLTSSLSVTNNSVNLTYGGSNGENAYTFDGDGILSCTSSDTTKVTCNVNTTTSKIELTPTGATTTNVTIEVSALEGTNYFAPTPQTFTVSVAKGESSITCNTPQNWTGSSMQSYTAYSGCTPSTNTSVSDANTYTVTCTGDANHNNSTCSFTINKVAASITCNSAQTYTGSAITSYSSATGCASIDNNAPTSAGTYTVKCNQDGNHNTSPTCSFTINKKATTMSINPTSGTITFGSSTTTITTNGDGTKSCSSSNTGVATCSVSGNTVTINGVANGSATITVSQAAGTNYNAATSKTYSVTVSYPLAATYIKNNVSGLQNVAGAYRYVGANPNNYVWFNNEQWRIIGVYGDQLKIIRATPSKTSQVYNSSTSSNAWSGSTMQSTYLYDTYWPKLNSTAQGMVNQSATWNVGACDSNIAAAAAYTCAQQTPWTGKIGLIATYECLYAAENDGTCWTTSGYNYKDGCYQKDWLFSTVTNSGSSFAWTLSPLSGSSRSALIVDRNGYVYYDYVNVSRAASPVVYLKSTITITGGNGGSGQTNSYKLG